MNVRKPRPTSSVNHKTEDRASDTTEYANLNAEAFFQSVGFGIVYFTIGYFGLHIVLALFR